MLVEVERIDPGSIFRCSNISRLMGAADRQSSSCFDSSRQGSSKVLSASTDLHMINEKVFSVLFSSVPVIVRTFELNCLIFVTWFLHRRFKGKVFSVGFVVCLVLFIYVVLALSSSQLSRYHVCFLLSSIPIAIGATTDEEDGEFGSFTSFEPVIQHPPSSTPPFVLPMTEVKVQPCSFEYGYVIIMCILAVSSSTVCVSTVPSLLANQCARS